MRENGPESLEVVARWVYTSDHKRAQYLRENDYGPKTWLRPDNYVEYLEYAEQEAPRAKTPTKKPKQPVDGLDLGSLICRRTG